MKKSFLVNFSLLLLVNLLVKPAWLFGDMIVQRHTGEDYGVYFSLFNLSLLLNMFLDLGTSNYNNRKVAGNTNLFESYFTQIGTLRLVLSMIYLSLLLATGLLLNVSFYEFQLLLVLGAIQIFNSSLLFMRSNLTALGLFKWDSLFSVADKILMIALMLYFFKAGDLNITTFVWIQLLGYGSSAILAAIVLGANKAKFRFRWNKKFKQTLIRQSLPYALITILMASYSYIDSIMLRQLLDNGHAENAIYAQSFRVLMAGNNYAYLVAVLLLPLFSKMINKKESVEPLLRLSGSLMTWFTAVFALFACFYSKELISLLYGEGLDGDFWLRFKSSIKDYSNVMALNYSSKVFALLIIGIVPMSFNYTYGALLTAGGKMKILNTIAACTLGVNVLLNFVFIPDHGAYGAAVASVSTQFIAGLLQWWLAYRNFKIRFSLNHTLRFGVLIGGVFTLLFCLNEQVSMVFMLLITGFVAVIGVMVLKVVSLQNIRELLIKKP